MTNTVLAVDADVLKAWTASAEPMVAQLTAASAAVNAAGSATLAPIFGTVGAEFTAAYSALVAAHAASIIELRTAVQSMAAAVTDSGEAYSEHDREHADRLAGTYRDSLPSMSTGPLPSMTSAGADPNSYHPAPAGVSTPPDAAGGVQVSVPDVGVVTAPNPQAAAAVRAALTQLNVPYVWGGTTPGQALDCSGLTKFAYAQAGIEIPRVAKDQAIGRCVGTDPSQARPGDLAVWSGHVAMVVGNGGLIEAQQPGLPVAIDPIRTDNEGESFFGFFRPSESA